MILRIFWQFYVVLSVIVGQAAAYLAATYLSGNPDYIDLHGWPLGVGYFASAAMCWLLDLWINKSLDLALPLVRTGRTHQGWRRGFLLRPIRWVSAGMVMIGILLCFYHRTPEQLWRARQDQAARRTHSE